MLDFIGYWFRRYLMSTELYMVEKWERSIVHGIMLVVFMLFSYFNSTVLIYLVESITEVAKVMLDLVSNGTLSDATNKYAGCMYECFSNWISTNS